LKRLTDKDSAVELALKKFVQLVDVLARKGGESDAEVTDKAYARRCSLPLLFRSIVNSDIM